LNEEKKKPHMEESVPVSAAVGKKGAVPMQTLNPWFGAWGGGDVSMRSRGENVRELPHMTAVQLG